MGKTRTECSQDAYTSAFLSHWIQIVANSSPKSDIFNNKKKKKKTWPCFFAFYGGSGEANITIFFLLPYQRVNTWTVKFRKFGIVPVSSLFLALLKVFSFFLPSADPLLGRERAEAPPADDRRQAAMRHWGRRSDDLVERDHQRPAQPQLPEQRHVHRRGEISQEHLIFFLGGGVYCAPFSI